VLGFGRLDPTPVAVKQRQRHADTEIQGVLAIGFHTAIKGLHADVRNPTSLGVVDASTADGNIRLGFGHEWMLPQILRDGFERWNREGGLQFTGQGDDPDPRFAKCGGQR
jgi:hypothetical protein